MLIYFTSGTTSKPKLVEHSQVSYPVGHMSTMAWIGVRPGDVHLAISSPGWAKHAWSCFFAPWIAEATIFVYNYAPVRRRGAAGPASPRRRQHVLRAADGVAHADPVRPRRRNPKGCARSSARASRSTPTSSPRSERAWGLTIRDGFGQTETTLQVGNTPGQPVKAGSMGRPMPGVPVVLVDPVTGELADEGEICLDLSQAIR